MEEGRKKKDQLSVRINDLKMKIFAVQRRDSRPVTGRDVTSCR